MAVTTNGHYNSGDEVELIIEDPPKKHFIDKYELETVEPDDSSFKIFASFNKGFILRVKEGKE